MKMKLKHLESLLQQVDSFDKPKIELEQYPTSAELASQIIYSIANNEESFKNNSIIDLGVGTGMLTCGVLAYNPAYVLGIDIDEDALEICSRNIKDLFIESEEEIDINYELIQADIKDDNFFETFDKKADIVIMNPPFGTKNNEGIDMIFLNRAIQLAKNTVFSLHKTSTRKFIEKKIKEMDYGFKVIAELKFDVPKMYKFHKKNVKDIEVDLIKITL